MCWLLLTTRNPRSAAVNNQTNEGVAIKKITNVFSKKILAKRALREIKLLQHFRGHRNVSKHPPIVHGKLRDPPLTTTDHMLV
jgi:hypothetical protein